MSLNEKGLLPCPFCGGKPRVDLAKKTFCQLHGEPSQAVKVYCYHDCPARPSVESGDVFNGGEAKAREQAIAAWNRRAPASVPEDVAGVVERLRGYRPANEWGDPVQHTICDEAASALARVAKERDEARATLDEVCLSNRQEWQRATSAEAKLAEALADRAAQAERMARLEEAARDVVWFDWSDNDGDAVAAIERLRAALRAKEQETR